MTTPEDPHKALLFLAFPYGQGSCYDLVGVSLPPLPLGKITRQIQCKTTYMEELPITNWLSCLQLFKVTTTRLFGNKSQKINYKYLGNKTIELSPSSTRNYLWKIYVLNEGTLDLKIVFENETTKEYMYYLIELTVLKCNPLDTIQLTTCVRRPVEHKLVLENPLEVPITLDITCSSTLLQFQKAVKMDPFSEVSLALLQISK